MSTQGNEGEGNKTAARKYNETQRRFVRENEGAIEAGARDAERALDGPERQQLQEAEAAGKNRAAPDPETAQARPQQKPRIHDAD
jgi:hypothetical protein